MGREGDAMECFGGGWPIPEDPKDVWEVLDPFLNGVLGWGKTVEVLAKDVRRGSMGLHGLVANLERYVKEYGLMGSLFEGKFRILFEAISIA